jgi:hypothetical protein
VTIAAASASRITPAEIGIARNVVFTMPKELAAIAYQNKELVYGILFRAAADTLRIIAADPKHLGAEIGFFAVLHTWGQNLLHHPHLHCVIPGGGLSPDGARWISCRKGFFLPVAVLSCLFRRLFLEYLTAAFDAGKLKFFHTLEPLWERRAFLRTLAPLWNAKWVVHAKRPFAGPEQVLDYVGRYTHRVAISNNRLESMDDANVSFRWKDYRDYNKQKTMTLTGEEFIRRFLLHVVPRGLSTDPLLRLPRQFLPGAEARPMPRIARQPEAAATVRRASRSRTDEGLS